MAFATRIYANAEFDAGYDSFVRTTGGELDFSDGVQVRALLVWLNSWGCRQFAIEHHARSAVAIAEWAVSWETRLPDKRIPPEALDDPAIDKASDSYAVLMGVFASERKGVAGPHTVRVGPTGAAKILFAARPESLPPWDEPIRARLGYDGSPTSYAEYLRWVRNEIDELCRDAAANGVKATDIPARLGRARSSLPKMVDEYNWVTMTHSLKSPSAAEVAEWAAWARVKPEGPSASPSHELRHPEASRSGAMQPCHLK